MPSLFRMEQIAVAVAVDVSVAAEYATKVAAT